MANAELEADVRLRRVLEAWVFDLAGNLICGKGKDLVSGNVTGGQESGHMHKAYGS